MSLLCYNQLKALYFCKYDTTAYFLSVRITLKRADHFAFFYKDMEIFNALCYQLIAGKLKWKAKEYLSDNTRFSEICNYVLFDGEKVIKPEDLKECDTTEVLSVFGIDKKQIVKQKWRDLLKSVSVKHTGQMYVILIGAEAQTDIHYAMPVKTMIYDALNYGEQVNEAKKCHRKNRDYRSSDEFLSGFTLDDKLTPVITITLYLGTTQWDGPRSLAEMMPQMDERILPFINDYRINLLNPLEITDFSKFETGLRPLFELLKNASDEEKLNDLITKDETFTRVDVETVAAINLFVGTDIKYDEKEEVVNMCKAWDDHKKRGIQEGMQRGMQQGMQQGRLFEIYLSVQEGDYSAKRGAEKAEMSLDEFEKAMSKAGYKIPELV